MPTFPTYDGELPSCLNPWNPRHYLLVLYWVFFRPTALKCYLYQADPELYQTYGGWENFLKIFKNSSYRMLWITALIATTGLSAIFFFVSNVLTDVFITTHVACPNGVIDQIEKLCQPVDVKSEQLTFIYWNQWFTGHYWIMVSEFLSGVFSGICLNLMIFYLVSYQGIAFSFSTAFSVIFSVSFGISFSVKFGFLKYVALGTAFSTISGVTSGLLTTMAMGLLFAFNTVVVISSPTVGFSTFLAMTPIAVGIGAFRLPFYIMELLALITSRFMIKIHPIEWDELGIFPLPGSKKYLFNALINSDNNGLQKIFNAWTNPFQVSVAQQACFDYLHRYQNPISILFHWSTSPQLSQYAVAPLRRIEWHNLPIRYGIFAELNHQFVSLRGNGSEVGSLTEILIYTLTKHFRNNTVTPLTDFAGIFYRLFTHNEETDPPYDLLADRPIYTALSNYPYGTEIAESFETIGQSLTYTTLDAIATADSPPPRTENELRPTILQTLHDFHLVRQEIHTAIIATSNTNRLRSIALANDRLLQLRTYITDTVPSGYPEHKLLLRITRQWQEIITQAGGTAAREQLLTPVSNPYVAGNPVTGKLFVGRDDILQRIEELWTQPNQLSSIVLYGHRRMGKTSILRNLPGRFGPHTHIIDFNLQRVMFDDLSGFLYRLALELHSALPTSLQTHIPEPTEDQYYNTHNPTTQLDRLLKLIQTHRQNVGVASQNGNRFILAIDEFEILEDLITQGKIEPTIIAYLRALIQTYPWFILIFAGLHTLQEMTENYWNPLFGSVTRIRVSTLSQAAAYQLITNPTDDFPIDYDTDAIDRIIHLSGGQPYLTQLLCQSLITRFNRIRFEERREIEPRFTLQDVETIVASPDFYRDGNAYFSALWDQATETHAPTQHHILRALTQSPRTLTELTQLIPNSNLLPALQVLIEHDVIAKENDRYTYRVELLRLWVRDQSIPTV